MERAFACDRVKGDACVYASAMEMHRLVPSQMSIDGVRWRHTSESTKTLTKDLQRRSAG